MVFYPRENWQENTCWCAKAAIFNWKKWGIEVVSKIIANDITAINRQRLAEVTIVKRVVCPVNQNDGAVDILTVKTWTLVLFRSKQQIEANRFITRTDWRKRKLQYGGITGRSSRNRIK